MEVTAIAIKEETRLLMSIIDHKTPFNSVLQLKSHEEQNADVCLCFMCTRDVKQICTLETKENKETKIIKEKHVLTPTERQKENNNNNNQ